MLPLKANYSPGQLIQTHLPLYTSKTKLLADAIIKNMEIVKINTKAAITEFINVDYNFQEQFLPIIWN